MLKRIFKEIDNGLFFLLYMGLFDCFFEKLYTKTFRRMGVIDLKIYLIDQICV